MLLQHVSIHTTSRPDPPASCPPCPTPLRPAGSPMGSARRRLQTPFNSNAALPADNPRRSTRLGGDA